VEFLFGARSEAHLVGLEDARTAWPARARLHLCTDDGSRGFRGNVVEKLDRLAPGLAAPLVIHACGPHAMLARWRAGAPPGRSRVLAMESVMACGPASAAAARCRDRPPPAPPSTGAHAVAPGKPRIRHVLHRGPVFEAHDLDWERWSEGPVDLAVRVGPMRLANPVLVASGTFGYGDEYAHVLDVGDLGAVITKTVTLAPRVGNPPRGSPRPGGMLNSIGLENVGLAASAGKSCRPARARRHHRGLGRGETPASWSGCSKAWGARRE